MKKIFTKKVNFNLLDHFLTNFARKILEKKATKFIKSHNQMACFVFDHIANEINLTGVYEGTHLSILSDWLQKTYPNHLNGTAIDIGANIGNHSLFFSSLFKNIISFEPNQKTFNLLQFNSFLKENIKCLNYGISSSQKEAHFKIHQTNIGGSSIVENSDSQTITIQLNSLDYFIHDDINVKLIKIDVEGHEYEAIIGSKNTIQKNKPIILFEQQENELINGSSKVIELLKELGYNHFLTIEEKTIFNFLSSRRIRNFINTLVWGILGKKYFIAEHIFLKAKFYPFIIAIHSSDQIED